METICMSEGWILPIIILRICEIDTVSPYYERFPSDREEMRKEYDELKKQLEEEGKL